MEIIGKIYGEFQGVLGLIMTFFGGLSDLSSAPVAAASGISGIAAAFKMIVDSIKSVIPAKEAE